MEFLLKAASFFSGISFPEYKNVNELKLVQNRLHSSQTLFGDLNAKVLVLLQDSANWETFAESSRQDADFFRHHPDRVTNKRLVELFGREYDVDVFGSKATTCGLFCANIVWLLKKGDMSARLKNRRKVVQACKSVFDETINSLPNLKLIIAFGKETFLSASELLEVKSISWREAVIDRAVIPTVYNNKSFGLCTVPHPASRGKYREKLSPAEDDPWGADIVSWINYINGERR